MYFCPKAVPGERREGGRYLHQSEAGFHVRAGVLDLSNHYLKSLILFEFLKKKGHVCEF